MMDPMTAYLDGVPELRTPEDLRAMLSDPVARICSGALYKIMIKGDAGEDSLVVPFKPNPAQRRFLRSVWHRSCLLKARQLGFTTLVAVVWLDHALFNANQRCGVIAHNREAAETIFRDKVKFAYENLPEMLREAMPLARDSAAELLFAHNNSSIRVGTSMRSGTLHRLHISEFGKICAEDPKKAREVVTGSIPAVPKNGVLVIESTAEGREGEFYNITMRAKALHQLRKRLTERDYRFHFYPWHDEPRYRMDPGMVPLTDRDRQYFEQVEASQGIVIDPSQRAWYVATRDADFSGAAEKMWQEYPSTPDEAFQVSTEGTYFVNELARIRKEQRITVVPWEPSIPVNTFWDIGLNDEMAIWFHQRIGMQDRFIRYYENSGESFGHYVNYMQAQGYVWGTHYLPHDGDTERLGTVRNWTPRQMLTDLNLRNIQIVPRIDSIIAGIQMTRDALASCWFDQTNCDQGIKHLENYRKEWNDRLGVWKETPRHDKASNGADAFRQFAQGYTPSTGASWKRKSSNPRTV